MQINCCTLPSWCNLDASKTLPVMWGKRLIVVIRRPFDWCGEMFFRLIQWVMSFFKSQLPVFSPEMKTGSILPRKEEDEFQECFEEFKPEKGQRLKVSLPKEWLETHPQAEWDPLSSQIRLPLGWYIAQQTGECYKKIRVFNEAGVEIF